MILAKVLGNVVVVTEYPYRGMFPMAVQGDMFNAALVGHIGQEFAKNVREGDDVAVSGHFIEEKTFGKVFLLETMNFSNDAIIGRNLNVMG